MKQRSALANIHMRSR